MIKSNPILRRARQPDAFVGVFARRGIFTGELRPRASGPLALMLAARVARARRLLAHGPSLPRRRRSLATAWALLAVLTICGSRADAARIKPACAGTSFYSIGGPALLVRNRASGLDIVSKISVLPRRFPWARNPADPTRGVYLSYAIDRAPAIFIAPSGSNSIMIKTLPLKSGVHRITIALVLKGEAIQRRTFCLRVPSDRP